jgi:integrase
MAALKQRDGVAARALEFTILTAARTGEVIGARWDEFDFATGTWTVPGVRMKAGREHRVALSDRAIEILKFVPREKENHFVFIGPRAGGLSNMAMAAVLRRMDRAEITVHGFRSTFRDWAAETTAFPNHVVEMALAHTVSNKVEAAYRRGDLLEKRRKLLAEWSRHCSTEARTKPAQLIPIRKS